MLGRLRSEASNLFRMAKRIVVVFVAAFVGFTFVPTTRDLSGLSFTAAVVSNSVSVVVLRHMETFLLPPGETLIVLGPFDALMGIMEVGTFLSLIVAIPYASWEIYRYVRSGLKLFERRAVARCVAIGSGLFVAGSSTILFWALPALYVFNYQLQPIAGVSPTVSLLGFLSTTVLFVVGVGLSLETPAVCYGLAVAGLLRSESMLRHWRAAMLGSFVLALLISPGVGGGITEGGMGGAIFSAYLASCWTVKRVERNRAILRHRTLAQVAG